MPVNDPSAYADEDGDDDYASLFASRAHKETLNLKDRSLPVCFGVAESKNVSNNNNNKIHTKPIDDDDLLYDPDKVLQILEDNKARLEQRTIPVFFAQHLLKHDVITESEYDDVQIRLSSQDINHPSKRDSIFNAINAELYTFMKRTVTKNPCQIRSIINALKENGWNADLADLIENKVKFECTKSKKKSSLPTTPLISSPHNTLDSGFTPSAIRTVNPMEGVSVDFNIPEKISYSIERKEKMQLVHLLDQLRSTKTKSKSYFFRFIPDFFLFRAVVQLDNCSRNGWKWQDSLGLRLCSPCS